jgi:hypothetical protein
MTSKRTKLPGNPAAALDMARAIRAAKAQRAAERQRNREDRGAETTQGPAGGRGSTVSPRLPSALEIWTLAATTATAVEWTFSGLKPALCQGRDGVG